MNNQRKEKTMARKGLGTGLDSFFGDNDIAEITAPSAESGTTELLTTEIEPNKNQPRKTFDKEKIEALASSIREQGIIQPIVVTPQKNGRYMIVAGERRWRAAKKAGLKKVPVVVKEYTQEEIAQIALVENLQREDLNPIEEALGYRSLLEEYSLTQEAVSTITGKSRSAVANSIRLLSLDKDEQILLLDGKITSGHARALLSIEDKSIRKALAERIVGENLNVRQAEAAAKAMQKQRSVTKKKNPAVMAEILRLEESLASSLGTKVKISHTKKKGKIEIEYYGNEDLERILGLISKEGVF